MRAALLSLLLSGSALAATPAPLDLSARPAVPPPPAWTAPAPTERVTAAGTRVVVLAEHALPLVHVVVSVPAGSALDPPDRPGLAAATAMMLQDGGAGGRSAAAVAEALAGLGASLHVWVDPDEVQLSLTVLARNLDRALPLVGDVLARPRFDAAEWPRARARRLDEIRRRRDEPPYIADDVFERVLYGQHPYAHPSLGTLDAVGALTVDELRRFYAAHYGPRTVTFVLYGDTAPAPATAAVARALAGWQSTAAPPPLPPAVTPGPARFVVVDRPGAPQSELRVGHLGRDRKTPDFPALSLLETVLGGSFTSRLNQNLREKHGYTYGARAHFELMRGTGPFVASTAVRTDATAAALAETVAELTAMRKPLLPDELVKGRSLVLQSVVEAFSDGLEATSYLADLTQHGLPLDFWSRLPGAMAALDLPALTHAAARLFFPDRLTIVVVGDRKAIDASLHKLPFAKTIEYRDVDGNPIQ